MSCAVVHTRWVLQNVEQQQCQTNPSTEIVHTTGETFADGSIIELVSSTRDGELQLLLCENDQHLTVAPHIDFNGHRYVPLQLDKSLRQTMRFPSVPATPLGNSQKLAGEIASLFQDNFGFSEDDSALLTAWSCSTWFPETWWHAPELVITGANMDIAMMLLRLLGCLDRHPLLLTGVERPSTIARLMQAQPTLLLNQPGISPRTLQFLRCSNYRDVVVPGSRGAVSEFAGSRALFVGTGSNQVPAFHISMAAASRPRYLTASECRQIAEHFQPLLLSYRLRHWARTSTQFASAGPLPSGTQLSRLEICVPGDEQFAARVAATVENQENDLRAEMARRPESVLVEILWAPAHTLPKIYVKEITQLFNALRWSRGERDEYNEVEIGLMLANQGFPRNRNGSGMVVRFSLDVCQRLHALAVQCGLNPAKFSDCTTCSAS